ncbi:MAG: M14 family zinc carboxypeptidase [Bacteroidia bacterium]
MKTQAWTSLLLVVFLHFGALSAQHALIRMPHPIDPGIAAQLSIDHFTRIGSDSIDWIANRDEQAILQSHIIGYRTITADMESFVAQQLQQSQARTACGLQNYSSGSMGGYHTYAEVVAELNLMQQLFPTLCGTPYSIGQSYEGRELYALKLSDQPQLDQSNTEARVYIDALTHAREPLSMESLLAFAWWLLENYGQDETATYLLDNREIYILPVINPDGYVFNEEGFPNGGGYWRKNRNDSKGKDCIGVDVNRNFPLAWGNLMGATNTPCSETYHGDSASSELETAATRHMIDTLGATAGFSLHSYGHTILHPWLWQNSSTDFALSSELASDFIPSSYEAYGNGPEMLNYLASGTTADYMQSKNMLAWTPEIGHSFWEPASKICEIVEEMRKPLTHICWLAGDFARIQNYDHSPVIPGDTTGLRVRIKNRGVGMTANDVKIHCRSLSPDLVVVDPVVSLGDIAARNARTWSVLPIRLFVSPNANQMLALEISVRQGQDGGLSDRDTLYLRPGFSALLYSEDFENGRANWVQQGGSWDLTLEDAYEGQYCLSESPNSLNSQQNLTTIALDIPISIPAAGYPELIFWNKYSLTPRELEVRLQIEKGDGNWVNQQAPSMILYNGNIPTWTGHQYWQEERLDLSAFRGETIRIRWTFNGSPNAISDGYYLDKIVIRTYLTPLQTVGIKTPIIAPESIKWLALDGYWPMYIEGIAANQSGLSLTYFDVMGRQVLQQSLGTLSSGERQNLPELPDFKGPILIVIQNETGILARRWVMVF